MRQGHIWLESIQIRNGSAKSSAVIEWADGITSKLWYQLPEQYMPWITTSADPFVIGSLFQVMQQGCPLRVHSAVSPSLLANLEEFQAIWSAWRPKHLHPVEISADLEQEPEAGSRGDQAIASFSGGVDSCFTAYRHRTNQCGRQHRELCAGLMVHGFDIPLADDSFEKALKKSAMMMQSIGMECIPMATNFREVSTIDWEDSFGTGIASCLHILGSRFSTGIIASSCEKCTRNMLNFRIAGHPYPECFYQKMSRSRVATTRLNQTSLEIWRQLYANAKTEGIGATWLVAIGTAILLNYPWVMLEKCMPDHIKRTARSIANKNTI